MCFVLGQVAAPKLLVLGVCVWGLAKIQENLEHQKPLRTPTLGETQEHLFGDWDRGASNLRKLEGG